MQKHILIAFGLILLIIFTIRTVGAFQTPGWNLWDFYNLGGFIFAGALIWKGWKFWKA